MNIFPIGTIAAASSSGTINSISYSMFEPNKNVSSKSIHNILTTTYLDQTLITRKGSLPYITLQYEYDNIYNKEYKQIEHFIDSIGEDGLNSFYAIDWSKGLTPASVTNDSGDWIVAITNTILFSTVTNQKANRVVLWDGENWKEGQVNAIVANTSVTVDVDTNNYGALTLANANSNGMIYPLYQVYNVSGSLQSFKPTEFLKGSVNLTGVGGNMYSGNISFISKYKV